MERVTGIGGVFLKSSDPEKLHEWYEKHLGLGRDSESKAVVFKWRDYEHREKAGSTLLAFFPKDTKYFHPSRSPFMVNLRVSDLDGLLGVLREEGVEIDERREEYEYGRFAWIMDPEGNRIELWEPPEGR